MCARPSPFSLYSPPSLTFTSGPFPSLHPSSFQSARYGLGDKVYSLMCAPSFSISKILETIDLSDEHAALDLASRVEAAMHFWRRAASMAHSR